jgi:hypothetical protein
MSRALRSIQEVESESAELMAVNVEIASSRRW